MPLIRSKPALFQAFVFCVLPPKKAALVSCLSYTLPVQFPAFVQILDYGRFHTAHSGIPEECQAGMLHPVTVVLRHTSDFRILPQMRGGNRTIPPSTASTSPFTQGGLFSLPPLCGSCAADPGVVGFAKQSSEGLL